MPQQEPVESTAATVTAQAEPHVPSPEEMERTKKVMQDSLAARKPKGLLGSLKEWFR